MATSRPGRLLPGGTRVRRDAAFEATRLATAIVSDGLELLQVFGGVVLAVVVGWVGFEELADATEWDSGFEAHRDCGDG